MRFQRLLKLKHLVLIRTLGTELNLRRCAELLNTSQSAVSRTLLEIEDLLGEKLFERSTRSVKPTQIGINLIWHAQRILGDIEQAEADFNALARGITQILYVGVLPGFDPSLLSRAVGLFTKRCPNVELHLHEGLAADLFVNLRQDRVDLILSHVDIPRDDADIVAEQLYEEGVSIVAAPSHALAKRKRLTMSDLLDQRWLLPPVGTNVRIAMERELMLNAGQQLPPIVECTSPHFAGAMLQGSSMIAALPRGVAQWLVHDCGVVRELKLYPPLPVWPVCVARHSTRSASSAHKDFVACLIEAAESANRATETMKP